MSTSNTAAIAAMYNARSASYDSNHNSLHVRPTQTYLSHLTPYLHPGATLLDLAYVTGLVILPAKSLFGVDLSEGMLTYVHAIMLKNAIKGRRSVIYNDIKLE